MKENKILSNEELIPNIFEYSHDAIIAIDEMHNIILFNQDAERLFGYSRTEAIGKQLDMLLPPSILTINSFELNRNQNSHNSILMMSEIEKHVGMSKSGATIKVEAKVCKFTSEGQSIFSIFLRNSADEEKSGKNYNSRAFRLKNKSRNIINALKNIAIKN
jgi:PAS domain S-box-containing protein